MALGITLLLGVAFVNSTVYLYQQLLMGFDTENISPLLYAVTGAHLVMVVGGLLFAAVMAFQALGGQLTGRDAEGMSAAALYWYVTVVVYIAVWYGVRSEEHTSELQSLMRISYAASRLKKNPPPTP